MELAILDITRINPEFEAITARFKFRGVSFTSCVHPAEQSGGGGNWCEAFALSESITVLSVGGVCGHGIEKFVVMSKLRQSIRETASLAMNPADVLAVVHNTLIDEFPSISATAIVAFLDTEKQTLAFANAGHPAPLLVNDFGSSFLEFRGANLPLGIPATAPACRLVDLRAGSLLVFYTDGVIDYDRDKIRGAQRLQRTASYAYDCLHSRTAAFIRDEMGLEGSNRDDMAILTAWMASPTVPDSRKHDRSVVYLQQR